MAQKLVKSRCRGPTSLGDVVELLESLPEGLATPRQLGTIAVPARDDPRLTRGSAVAYLFVHRGSAGCTCLVLHGNVLYRLVVVTRVRRPFYRAS